MNVSSQVMIGLDGKNHAVFADLSEAEFFWVGQMTCSWAMLEDLMMGITKTAAAFYEQSLPDNCETLPFKKRFTLFQEMIVHIKPEEVRKPLENVIGRIAGVQEERHDFTHGTWEWNYQAPHKVKVDHARKKGHQNKKYDADGIRAIATRIAEINFVLSFPLGEDQFYAQEAERGSSMSRRYAIQFTGAQTNDPTLTYEHLVSEEIKDVYTKAVAATSETQDDDMKL
jgi:hypothetical protein